MSDNPFDAPENNSPGTQSKKTFPMLMLGVVVLAVAVASYIFLKGNTNQVEKSQATTQSSAKSQTTSSQSAAVSVSEKVSSMLPGKKVYNVCLDEWTGYVGGPYFNRGFDPNADSQYTKKYGISVRFVSTESKEESRQNWLAGKCDILWGNPDSFASEALKFSKKGITPSFLFIVDRSNGGDALFARRGINNISDLKGKKVAFLPSSASHTILLKALLSSGMSIEDIVPMETESGAKAAEMFSSGQVDAAVAWSPNYEEAVKATHGSKVLFTTKQATHVIFDGFFAEKNHYEKNKEAIDSIAAGWLIANAEINTSAEAKKEAAKIFAKKYNSSPEDVLKSIDLSWLSTTGDNRQFFGADAGEKVTADEVFTDGAKMYQKFGYNSMVPSIPAWRDFFSPGLVQSLSVKSSADAAEKEITVDMSNAATKSAVSTKALAVVFPSGSYQLDEKAKMLIREEFGSVARSNRGFIIRVEGNTDSVGNVDSNQALSLKRAQAAADYLQSIGANKNNLIVIGHGSSNKLKDCQSDSKECNTKNRRTEFSLVK